MKEIKGKQTGIVYLEICFVKKRLYRLSIIHNAYNVNNYSNQVLNKIIVYIL